VRQNVPNRTSTLYLSLSFYLSKGIKLFANILVNFSFSKLQGDPQNTKLLYFVHIFAKIDKFYNGFHQ